MKNLLLLSVTCLLIKASGFAESTPVTKSRLKTLIIENKLDEAKTFANQEIQNNPGDTDIIRRRGFVHFMQGDYQSAINDFTSYLAVRPASAKGYLYRGLAYIALGNDQNGKDDVRKALSLNPELKTTVEELKPKMAAAPKKASSRVPMTTKKGVPVMTKKGAVSYKAKR